MQTLQGVRPTIAADNILDDSYTALISLVKRCWLHAANARPNFTTISSSINDVLLAQRISTLNTNDRLATTDAATTGLVLSKCIIHTYCNCMHYDICMSSYDVFGFIVVSSAPNCLQAMVLEIELA
jgi:hypothetical protein